MQNFSQINKSTKRKKQKQVQNTFQFKIQPPITERKSKDPVPQSSFLDLSEKSIGSLLKNTARSSSSDRLQQQYISFKLKPSNKNHLNILKENDFKINPNNKNTSFSKNYFIQNDLYVAESEKSSFAKSPQFVCKRTSPINSEKESFSGFSEQNSNYQNFPTFINQNFLIHKKVSKQKCIDSQKTRTQTFDHFHSNDSSLDLQNQRFQNYEIHTPYKDLKEQFQRQERNLLRQKRKDNYQFDSFSQFNPKDNFIPFEKNIKTTQQNFQQSQGKYQCQNLKNKSLRKRITDQIQNVDMNKQFFFLTDPTLDQTQKCHQMETKNKEKQRQKQVKEFCFNISEIMFQDEKNPQLFNNPNLFSNNSNEYLMFFDSKYTKKEEYSQNSKRMHVRQLVQEFIQQLQHVDDKSLNEKVVSNLENILQEIVFKQPKQKSEPIKIQNDHEYLPLEKDEQDIKNYYDDTKFKKWTKPSRQNGNSVSWQRKLFDQRYEIQNGQSSQMKETSYSPSYIRNENHHVDKFSYKNPIYEKSSISKKQKENNDSGVYKPNFSYSPSQSFLNKKINEQVTPKRDLMFSKNRNNESSQIRINPKGSIYFNKKKSHSRQHLKTQTNQKSWRVY